MNYLIVGVISLVVAAGGLFASKEFNKQSTVVVTTTTQTRSTPTIAASVAAKETPKVVVEAPKSATTIVATASVSITTPDPVVQPPSPVITEQTKTFYASGVDPMVSTTTALMTVDLVAQNIDDKQREIIALNGEISGARIGLMSRFLGMIQRNQYQQIIDDDLAKIAKLQDQILQLQTTGTLTQ